MPTRQSLPSLLTLLFVSFLTITLGLKPASALTAVPEPCPTPTTPSAKALEEEILAQRCTATKTTSCLKVLTNYACRNNGCPRQGYNWVRSSTDSVESKLLDIHMSMKYLRRLRDAAMESPTSVLCHSASLGFTLEDLLYHQVEAFLNDPSARYYNASLAPMQLSAVRSGNSVDPSLFYMVTFVNNPSLNSFSAEAMTQGDFGSWLLSVAKAWAAKKNGTKVNYFLRLSERVFRAFGVRHAEGGVRSDKIGNTCNGNQYCYWFHSGPDNTSAKAETVLNQNLHAIRDALVAHAELALWRDHGSSGMALPAEFDNGHINHLMDWGRGGLNQLVYSGGNIADYSAPPNLADFMQRFVPEVPRYNAYYKFDMSNHNGFNGNTRGNVCHYHFHDLALFAEILTLIRDNVYFRTGADFIALYYKLLYGRSLGDTRSCNNRSSIPDSKKIMTGLPLAEFHYYGVLSGSTFPFGGCAEKGLYLQVDERGLPVDKVRLFFHNAYAGCKF